MNIGGANGVEGEFEEKSPAKEKKRDKENGKRPISEMG